MYVCIAALCEILLQYECAACVYVLRAGCHVPLKHIFIRTKSDCGYCWTVKMSFRSAYICIYVSRSRALLRYETYTSILFCHTHTHTPVIIELMKILLRATSIYLYLCRALTMYFYDIVYIIVTYIRIHSRSTI